MASATTKRVASLITVGQTILYPISSLSVMCFIYGMTDDFMFKTQCHINTILLAGGYVVLFGVYLYMIRNHEQRLDRTTTVNRLYPRLAAALFMLSTVFVVFYITFYITDSVVLFDTLKSGDYQALAIYLMPIRNSKRVVFYGISYLIPVVLNGLAEWMLIHRCYAIWGSIKRISVPLILASILINGLGLISIVIMLIGLTKGLIRLYLQGDTINGAYSISSTVLNSILTLLTAGRIWWIHRQVRSHGIHTNDKLVHSVCRIIIESGLLYPLSQIAGSVLINTLKPTVVPFDFGPVITLSAGIAPTLVMVRGKLGKNVESLRTAVIPDIQIDSQPGPVAITSRQAQPFNTTMIEVVVERRAEEGKTSV